MNQVLLLYIIFFLLFAGRMARSNFQRGQSKVWFGNVENNLYGGYYYPQFKPRLSAYQNVEEEEELQRTPEKRVPNSWSNRQGSPASHKSQVS